MSARSAMLTAILITQLMSASICPGQPVQSPSSGSDAIDESALLIAITSDRRDRRLDGIYSAGQRRSQSKVIIEELTGLLGHSDACVRWGAAWALVEIGEPSVESVATRLRDHEVTARRTAAYVLSRLGTDSPQANLLLLPTAADADPLARFFGNGAISQLQPDLWAAAPSDRFALRVALLRQFRLPARIAKYHYNYKSRVRTLNHRLGPITPDELPGLLTLFDDPVDDVLIATCITLAELGPDAAPASLQLARLLETRVPVADAAMSTLSAIGEGAAPALPAVLRRLERLIQDGDTNFGREVRLLGLFGDKSVEAIPNLLRLCQQSGGHWAEASNRQGYRDAQIALARIASEPPAELMAWLSSSSQVKRRSGAFTLGAFGSRAGIAVPRLVELLNDKDQSVALAALVAIEEIGMPAAAAIPVLADIARKEHAGGVEHFLKNPDRTPLRRYYHPRLVQVIGKLGPEALPVLVEFLGHKSHELREDAAIGLGFLGASAASTVPQLVELAKGDDYGPANAAIQTLGGLGPAAKSAIPVLIGLLRNENREDRLREIVTALIRIGIDDEQVINVLHDETMLRESYSYSQVVPQVMFDNGLLTTSDLWDLAGESSFPLEWSDPRWPAFAKDHMPLLVRALEDVDNPKRRRWGAAALRHINPSDHPEVTSILAAHLDSEMARNVLVFARATGEGTPRAWATTPLIAQLSSESDVQRGQASELLSRHYLHSLATQELSALRDFVQNPPAHAVETAAYMSDRLKYAGIPSRVRPYSELAQLAIAASNRDVLKELTTYGAAATPLLEEIAANKTDRGISRVWAIDGLGALRAQSEEARDTLEHIANDAAESAHIRGRAQAALKSIDESIDRE